MPTERVTWPVLLITCLLIAAVLKTALGGRPDPRLPIVTIERKGFLEKLLPAHILWIKDANSMILKGLKEFSNTCFQVPTASGYKVIVPNRFADELKAHPGLNFNEAFAKDFFVDYPGFEGLRQGLEDDTFMQEVVRVKLTQSLGLVTDDLVEEASDSVRDMFGDIREWRTVLLKDHILDVVARLSSRVFLGKDLCRNTEWLRITKDYTVDTFMSANLLHLCPGLVRPLVYWFIPTCTRLRKEVRDARRLIMPEVEKRRMRAEEALQEGKKGPKVADAIGWMVDVSKGRPVDYVAAQLSLSMAAIHTTSETTTNCMLQLCENPEAVQLLRKEVIEVLSENGWSKISLYKMKLMDSFLKEVQRTRGLTSTSMNRLVKKDITLSDGTVLHTGARIMVSDDKVNDASVYTEPEKFDIARFMRMREQAGEENRHQFVTTTSDHMGFGHGQHACPGRFFASNEIKILLCFLLLKYDFRFVPGQDRPRYMAFEAAKMADPQSKVQIRRRVEEIDLDLPQVAVSA